MNLKRIALIVGIALIPAWYVYRTLSEHRFGRLTFNEVFLTEDERLRKQIADEKGARGKGNFCSSLRVF